ncbi:PIN domain-containing protein [Desulfosporosinus meridiei]|uniref:DUF4935 domain-containing protein n=1 Tax=Desulfosporosinus meridiei (strain ATCC BAA-275 / DSM 13257 / KCTC 12902 / NCIMB 13706 / S10) TaxID=768704 RepID=J7ISR7_DESMD|nr:PIN domain-containing protein [Desulfosporosinus meridiei]AFQ44902.1 hypothetical protein Desmer_3018 [Desulfosporosinus meridiei DSM 13257]
MAKIFIDTNIYLDFYRSNNDKLKLFEDLIEYYGYLIFPTQVYDEFRRNRITEINNVISNIKKFKINYSTSIIRCMESFEEFEIARRKFYQEVDKIIQSLEGMVADSTKDPVAQSVKTIYDAQAVQKVEYDDNIIQKADRRHLLGNPPGTNKTTICDELIWEALLAHINEDIVIVSRDSTYRNSFDYLNEEYKNVKGGKCIHLTDKITEALKIIGQTPLDEMVELEEDQIQEALLDYKWKVVKDYGDRAVVTDGIKSGIMPISNYDSSWICPFCGNFGPWNGVRCMSCGRISDPMD